MRVVGVDPAANIAARANEAGVETICEFFGRRTPLALRERFGPARLVPARNVLAHVDDPRRVPVAGALLRGAAV